MKLSQFKFKLPEELIALNPPYHRDECRLMVVHRVSGKIEMYKTDDKGEPLKDENGNPEYLDFRNILDYFDEGDAFIFNDTKVFPARLYGTKEKTDAKIEVFLLRELNEEMRLWDVLVEPARKIRIGNKLFFDDSGTMVAEVIDNTTSRGRTLRFLYDCPHDEFKRDLYALGEAPLPHYIVDRRPATKEDLDDFQCIYAKNEGAVTAPASGLHFSRELMKRMEIKGIEFAFITLHCALGNFHDIEVEDLTKHKMDSEQMFINADACNLLIAVITAVILVLAMNLVGALLTSALIVFPALSAMRLFAAFRQVMIASALTAVVSAALGITASILFSTPVGATVVVVNAAVFLLCCLFKRA